MTLMVVQSFSDCQMLTLPEIEQYAASYGLALRLQVKYYLNLWTFTIVVARPRDTEAALLLGQIKGWAYGTHRGLQLDTLRVQGEYTNGISTLIWAATFSWALTHTPCHSARLLAINDESHQHLKLTRYFKRLGFQSKRIVQGDLVDLPLRLVWGGSGLIMEGDCSLGLMRCSHWLFYREYERNILNCKNYP